MTATPDRAITAWLPAMRAGDFEAAWRASDHVMAARAPAECDDPSQPYHLRWVWDGTPAAGRDVLVRCYHGLGDTLQFCRYLPALRRVAARVTLEVQAELVPLIASMGAVDRIVPFDPAAPLPPSACTIEIMELAHALRIAPEPVPYLPMDPVPAGSGMRIGLCWQAQAGWRPARSVPRSAVAALLPIEGAALRSLQPNQTLPGMSACPDTLLETARVIAGLDLVITVDTMVAHLAGAIGVPIWLLLDTEPDWRWLAGGRGSVWYRGVRKYEQEQPGEWVVPLAAIVADLTQCTRAGTLVV